MRQREAGFPDPTLERIAEAIRSIRYGIVSIVIQDTKVIQIEKTEKIRMGKADRTTGGRLTENSLTDQSTGGMDHSKGV